MTCTICDKKIGADEWPIIQGWRRVQGRWVCPECRMDRGNWQAQSTASYGVDTVDPGDSYGT